MFTFPTIISSYTKYDPSFVSTITILLYATEFCLENQLIGIFPTSQGDRRLIARLQEPTNSPYPEPNESTSSFTISVRHTISFSYLRLGLPNGLFRLFQKTFVHLLFFFYFFFSLRHTQGLGNQNPNSCRFSPCRWMTKELYSTKNQEILNNILCIKVREKCTTELF